MSSNELNGLTLTVALTNGTVTVGTQSKASGTYVRRGGSVELWLKIAAAASAPAATAAVGGRKESL